MVKLKMFKFKKEVITEPKIGEIWQSKSIDPFIEKMEIEVLDIKSGFIQYKHKGGTIPMSATINQFIQCYLKI